jgi:tRNA A-37 threonylcarbamoyl transferase component Bud32
LTGLTVLARGGYATVYAAIQESVGRDVAVKVENRRLETERDQRRFLREARAAGRMSSHPHVVDLFDAGVTNDDHPYLIMELCEGSYADRMRTAPLPPLEARDVGVKIADALSDAHSLGVLHRDVKPANILYSGFGEPTLADFGLAILAEGRDSSITVDVLTPAYAAPEMFRHAEPGPQGDVYALSATLYALMRGRPPRWPNEGTPSLAAVMDMFQQRIPDVAGVPPEFMALLRAGMANDVAARPTALEFRDALDRLAIDRPTADRPDPGERSERRGPPLVTAGPHRGPVTSAPRPSGPPGDPAAEDATVAHRPAKPRGGRHWWWPLAAVAAIVVTMLTLFMGHAFGGLLPNAAVSPRGVHASATGPCSRFLADGARCPGGHECYGQLSDTGTASPVDCAKPHTWEVFAVGDLPRSERRTDYRSVRENPAVQDICNQYGLVTLVPLGELGTWKVDVLPPTGHARSYRCLAGKGPDQLVGPQLGMTR